MGMSYLAEEARERVGEGIEEGWGGVEGEERGGGGGLEAGNR